MEGLLDESLKDVGDAEDHEVDFEPLKPRGGLVSALVRVMRDERSDGLP